VGVVGVGAGGVAAGVGCTCVRVVVIGAELSVSALKKMCSPRCVGERMHALLRSRRGGGGLCACSSCDRSCSPRVCQC